MMWFPEMFNRFDEWSRTHDNAPADICQVTAFVTQQGTHSSTTACDSHIQSDVFMESLITVAAAIPSNIFAVLGMDRLGRKFFLGKLIVKFTTKLFSLSDRVFILTIRLHSSFYLTIKSIKTLLLTCHFLSFDCCAIVT